MARSDIRSNVGWARYALTPDFDGWYSLAAHVAKTDEAGKAVFTEVPPGGVGTALVNTGEMIGSAHGSGTLEVKLAPPGSVKGKVLGKRSPQGSAHLGAGRERPRQRRGHGGQENRDV